MEVRYFKNIKAFTLIELVVSIVVIGIAVTGTLMVFTSTAKRSSDPMVLQQAMAIGKSYLEEIIAKDFPTTVPCPSPPAGGRAVYSNVCDYSGLSDIGATDQNGNSIAALSNYNVAVTIDTTTASMAGLVAGTDIVRIDIDISHPEINGVTISGYRAAY